MDVVTSLRQLTEMSDYISQDICTGEDPSLQNRTPMPFIFKMNGVLPSSGVYIIPPILISFHDNFILTEKTTFSCKDDCTLTKQCWKYSALWYFFNLLILYYFISYWFIFVNSGSSFHFSLLSFIFLIYSF